MSFPEEVGTQNLEHDASFDQQGAESRSRLRKSPIVSDVRALTRQDATDRDGDEGRATSQPIVSPPPLGMLRILDALESYEDSLPLDSEFWNALRSGDSAQVMNWLLRENIRLRRELASTLDDFEELRCMNVNVQEQSTVALVTADDARLALASELEGTKDKVLELESRLHETLSRMDSEAEQFELLHLALQSEIVDLRAQLAGR